MHFRKILFHVKFIVTIITFCFTCFATELNLDVGKDWEYDFKLKNIIIGNLKSKITEKKFINNKEVLVVKTKFHFNFSDLKGEKNNIKGEGKLLIDREALPLEYTLLVDNNGQKQELICRYVDNEVHETVTIGEGNLDKYLSLDKGTYILDNNMIEQWAIVCKNLDLSIGRKININAFVPSVLSKVAIKFLIVRKDILNLNRTEVECYVCEVEPINETFWISNSGELLKIENVIQDLTIIRKGV